MTLLRNAPFQRPLIRNLAERRAHLVAKWKDFRGRLAVVVAGSSLAVSPEKESDEEAATRIARAENRLILTDYAYHPHKRPIEAAASGRRLIARFLAEQERYGSALRGIARHSGRMGEILYAPTSPLAPYWDNPWFPPFDGAALYGLIAETSPHRYIEIGSGISTRFARRAILDLGLSTQIISIDPHPHNSVEGLCDEIIVSRMEDMSASFWADLSPGDMLFIDNSHRSFQGSDVTVFFSEVLPALPPGILYGIHDIFLPFDYPEEWRERFYSEQYLLLMYLLGGADGDEIVLPINWIATQPELHGLLDPLWQQKGLFGELSTHGGSFWLRRSDSGA
jgi:hypothetical protein